MNLFKKRKKIDELDYNLINEYAESGNKVNKLLQILIIIAIISLGLTLLQRLHILPIIGEFLSVISPVFIGILIAWLLVPLTDKLSKKMPRVLSCIIVYILVLGTLSLLFAYTIPNLIDQVKELSKSIPTMINELQKFINNATENLKIADNSTFNTLKKNFFVNLKEIDTGNIANMIIGGTMSAVGIISNLCLGLMIGFYLLFDYHKICKKIFKCIPTKYQSDARELRKRVNSSLRSYVQGVLIVMLLVFVSQAIGLTLAGHKAPLLFALICAITDIIPYFGPWIGGIPAAVVGFLISPLAGILTIVSIVVIQVLEGNLYQPLIMGHTMKLHPITIMLALLIFGHFFGIIGMIVATPATATLKVLFEFIDEKIEFINKIENA